MPPDVALLLWLFLLFALLVFDPAKERGMSLALWLPVIWISIDASKLPSQWLGYQSTTIRAQAFQQGNPVDRLVLGAIILLSIGVLFSRSFNWSRFLTRNFALTAFIGFALLSVLWSDYPYVTFKHWFRDLGGYVVILIVLSDPRPLEAVRTVLRRVAYLLIPLSVLLVRYFPRMGIAYDPWTGAPAFVGVTTTKNMLGALCMVAGVFFLWDTLTRWPERKDRHIKRILWVNYAFLAMTLWLLHDAHSDTSSITFALGCLIIALAHAKFGRRHPGLVKALPVAAFVSYLLAVIFGLSGVLNHAVGRQANFTDRTGIWKTLLTIHINPLLGVGYQSFWLGSRLQEVWQLVGPINEAHNGYLGIYLDLGLVGLFLIAALVASCYRRICKRITPFTPLGSLGLAFCGVLLFYNVTEAALESSLLVLIVLMAGLEFPERIRHFASGKVSAVPEQESEFADSPAELTEDWR